MFSQLSIELTKSLNQKTKKDNGIYFTPKNIIQLIITFITNYSKMYNLNIKTILEPSCGSCEFINALDSTFPNVEIDGIEYIEEIYKNIKGIAFTNPVTIINNDYLNITGDKKYDLIIGNPPYNVIKKNKVPKEYIKYCNGRPNIFVLFIIHSINKLNTDGLLAFVLPKNFLNCQYYNNIREFLYNTLTILTIIDCFSDNYIETGQETIILIVQNKMNKPNNDKYVIKNDNFIIFNTQENIIKLNKLYENSTNLNEYGFKVNVGTITWNENKHILTDNYNRTLLIYSGDIKDNKLLPKTYKDINKKNYIDKSGLKEPILLVNRGYGKGRYIFNYCLIDIEQQYLIENHLICIIYNGNIEKDILIEKYNNIIQSFNDNRTKQFIEIYFGNNAINTKELQYILPIYL